MPFTIRGWTVNGYTYSEYRSVVESLLPPSLVPPHVARDLPTHLFDHIGEGWKRKCRPQDTALLIISDYKVPARESV